MENISLGINVIAMIAGVVSAIVAIRAKNESKSLVNQINQIKLELEFKNDRGSSTENSGDILVENKGNNNSGIVAGIISGGVNRSGNKR